MISRCFSRRLPRVGWARPALVASWVVLGGCATGGIPLVDLTDNGRQWVWPYFVDGQPTVLAFWTTDEMECYRNVPALQGLDARGGSVQLVTVVTGRDRLEINKWIREKRIRYPVLLDLEQRLSSRLGVDNYPTFVFLDPMGKEIERQNDIRLVQKWFDRPRWLERVGAIAPVSAGATTSSQHGEES
jgi:hypothetical protein